MAKASMLMSPQLKQVLKQILDTEDEPNFVCRIDLSILKQQNQRPTDISYLILGHQQLYIAPSDLLYNAA